MRGARGSGPSPARPRSASPGPVRSAQGAPPPEPPPPRSAPPGAARPRYRLRFQPRYRQRERGGAGDSVLEVPASSYRLPQNSPTRFQGPLLCSG